MKKGYWIGLGVAALGALAAYFLFVRSNHAPDPVTAPHQQASPQVAAAVGRLKAVDADETVLAGVQDGLAEAIQEWKPEVYKPYAEYTPEELDRAGMTPVKLYGGGQSTRWQRLSLELRRAKHAELGQEAVALSGLFGRISNGRSSDLQAALKREQALVAALQEVQLEGESKRLFEKLFTAHDEMLRGIAPDVRAKIKSEDRNPEGPRKPDDEQTGEAPPTQPEIWGPKDRDQGNDDRPRPKSERSEPQELPEAEAHEH